MAISKVEGITLVVGVTAMDEALRFYAELFGRAPDFILADDFQEYEVVPGAWYQITTRVAAGKGRRVRIGVADIAAERRALISQGLEVSEIAGEPGVVAWCQFKDPFGTRRSQSSRGTLLTRPSGPVLARHPFDVLQAGRWTRTYEAPDDSTRSSSASSCPMRWSASTSCSTSTTSWAIA